MKRAGHFIILFSMFGALVTVMPISLQAQEKIGADQLKALLDSGPPVVLLDIRGQQAYRKGSVIGAVNAGTDPKGYLPDRSAGRVVLIAPAEIDESSLQAWMMRLEGVQDQPYLLYGGFNAWVAAGYEIEMVKDVYKASGTVPFVVPRGMCETGMPAQRFE